MLLRRPTTVASTLIYRWTFVCHQTLISQSADRRTIKSVSLVGSVTKNWLRYSAHIYPNYCRGQKVRNFRFSTPVTFEALIVEGRIFISITINGHLINFKRTVLVRKYVLWVITRENPAVWPRRRIEKKDSTVKKSHKVIINRLFQKSPLHRLNQNCMASNLPDIITCANCLNDILGVTIFIGVMGRISHFRINFCMCLTAVQCYCAVCNKVTPGSLEQLFRYITQCPHPLMVYPYMTTNYTRQCVVSLPQHFCKQKWTTKMSTPQLIFRQFKYCVSGRTEALEQLSGNSRAQDLIST